MIVKRYTCNGVVLDQPPIDVGDQYWTEATNMVAKPDRMTRALGYQRVYGTPVEGPIWLLYAEQLGTPIWVYGTANKIGTVDSAGNHTERLAALPSGGQTPGQWTGGMLNGVAIAHPEGNKGYYWFQGQTNAVELPGYRANVLYDAVRPHRSHLFGLGVTQDGTELPDAVHWSTGAPAGTVPPTWVPAADNEAGDAVLADDGGRIVDGKTLRDSFFIYKRDSTWEASYVGGALVYQFRKVFANSGVMSRNCIARVKGTHVVLGNGDIYQHDGQNIQSLGDGSIRRAFFDNINPEETDKAFVVYNEPQEEVWFCAPQVGETRPSLALVWDVVTKEFGYRELPGVDYAAAGVVEDASGAPTWDNTTETWDSDVTKWNSGIFNATEDKILMADQVQNRLLLGNSSNLADGRQFDSNLSKLGMSLDDPRMKSVRRIWPRIDSPEGMRFQVLLFDQRSPHDGQRYLGKVFFESGPEGIPVNVNVRNLGIRITALESLPWSCSGFDVEYTPRGNF